MRWLILMVVAIAAGCGGATCPPVAVASSSPSDPVVARVLEHERDTCACTTLMCATVARTEMQAWAREQRDALDRALEDPILEGQIDVHRGRAEKCRQALFEGASAAERVAADPDPVNKAIAQMAVMADQLCECADMKCAEQVMKGMSRMKEPSGKPSKGQMEKAMKIAEQMADCQRKLMTMDLPPPPPIP